MSVYSGSGKQILHHGGLSTQSVRNLVRSEVRSATANLSGSSSSSSATSGVGTSDGSTGGSSGGLDEGEVIDLITSEIATGVNTANLTVTGGSNLSTLNATGVSTLSTLNATGVTTLADGALQIDDDTTDGTVDPGNPTEMVAPIAFRMDDATSTKRKFVELQPVREEVLGSKVRGALDIYAGWSNEVESADPETKHRTKRIRIGEDETTVYGLLNGRDIRQDGVVLDELSEMVQPAFDPGSPEFVHRVTLTGANTGIANTFDILEVCVRSLPSDDSYLVMVIVGELLGGAATYNLKLVPIVVAEHGLVDAKSPAEPVYDVKTAIDLYDDTNGSGTFHRYVTAQSECWPVIIQEEAALTSVMVLHGIDLSIVTVDNLGAKIATHTNQSVHGNQITGAVLADPSTVMYTLLNLVLKQTFVTNATTGATFDLATFAPQGPATNYLYIDVLKPSFYALVADGENLTVWDVINDIPVIGGTFQMIGNTTILRLHVVEGRYQDTYYVWLVRGDGTLDVVYLDIRLLNQHGGVHFRLIASVYLFLPGIENNGVSRTNIRTAVHRSPSYDKGRYLLYMGYTTSAQNTDTIIFEFTPDSRISLLSSQVGFTDGTEAEGIAISDNHGDMLVNAKSDDTVDIYRLFGVSTFKAQHMDLTSYNGRRVRLGVTDSLAASYDLSLPDLPPTNNGDTVKWNASLGRLTWEGAQKASGEEYVLHPGNSYGETMKVGTLDNQPLHLVQNNADAMQLDGTSITTNRDIRLGTDTDAVVLKQPSSVTGLVPLTLPTTAPAVGQSIECTNATNGVTAWAGPYAKIGGDTVSGSMKLGTISNHTLQLTTNNTTRIKVTTDGNVEVTNALESASGGLSVGDVTLYEHPTQTAPYSLTYPQDAPSANDIQSFDASGVATFQPQNMTFTPAIAGPPTLGAWTLGTTPVGVADIRSVIYDTHYEKFYASTNVSGNNVWQSSDGKNLTAMTTQPRSASQMIATNNAGVIMCTHFNQGPQKTADGATWTTTGNPGVTGTRTIACNGSRWVLDGAINVNDPRFYWSDDDGDNWTEGKTNNATHDDGTNFASTALYVPGTGTFKGQFWFGFTGSTNVPKIMSSATAETGSWTLHSIPNLAQTTDGVFGFIATDTRLFAFTNGATYGIHYTDDGTSWTSLQEVVDYPTITAGWPSGGFWMSGSNTIICGTSDTTSEYLKSTDNGATWTLDTDQQSGMLERFGTYSSGKGIGVVMPLNNTGTSGQQVQYIEETIAVSNPAHNQINADRLYPNANTTDYLEWKDSSLQTNVPMVMGSYTNATRPATAPEGAMIWNSDLKHHQIFNGTDWLVNNSYNENGSWEDLIAKFSAGVKNAANPPTETQDINDFTVLQFDKQNTVTVTYHVLHDYKPGSTAYIHVHWYPTTNMTAGQTVVWDFRVKVARGHNQGEKLIATPTVLFATHTADGTETAGDHMITETTTGIDLREVDSIVMVRVEYDLTSTYPNNVVGLQADLHYQSTQETTKFRVPPFN